MRPSSATALHCHSMPRADRFSRRLVLLPQGMDVSLICDGSGAGRGGGEKKDVLPPLMPGMKPRQQA